MNKYLILFLNFFLIATLGNGQTIDNLNHFLDEENVILEFFIHSTEKTPSKSSKDGKNIIISPRVSSISSEMYDLDDQSFNVGVFVSQHPEYTSLNSVDNKKLINLDPIFTNNLKSGKNRILINVFDHLNEYLGLNTFFTFEVIIKNNNTNIPVTNKELKNSRDIKNLESGNTFFKNMLYAKALQKYLLIDNPSVQILRKIGIAYWEVGSLKTALKIFQNIVDGNEVEPVDYWNLSQLQDIHRMYSQAIENRKKYALLKPREIRTSLIKPDISYYNKLLSLEEDLNLINLQTNTIFSDFGGYTRFLNYGFIDNELINHFGEVLFFTSSSEKSSNPLDSKTIKPEKPTYNIFMSGINVPSFSITDTKILKGSIHSAYHEGPAVISENGRQIIFTKNDISNNNDHQLNLYYANFNNGIVSSVKRFLFGGGGYSTMHPSTTNDGSRLFLSSNILGGFGGMDLYYVDINSSGSFSKIVNLGPGINTEGNEVFPFIYDNTLFFSSDAHPGLGGFDILMATHLGTSFQNIVNIGAPFNSSKDDFSFFLDKGLTYGLLSSNRDGGKGSDDIYGFNINNRNKSLYVNGVDDYYTILKGDTLKAGGNGVLENDISSNSSSNIFQKLKILSLNTTIDTYPRFGIIDFNNDGTFTYVSNDNKAKLDSFSYRISNRSNQGDPIKVNIGIIDPNDPVINKYEYFFKTGLDLTKIIEINPIYFDVDKFDIQPDAAIELEKIISVMNDYPNMEIEVRVHSDCKGDDNQNLYYSDRRAKSSAQYIQERINNKDRIYGTGYGETKPKVKCTSGCSSCNESQHKLNRRTEFIIVNF